VRSLRWPNRRFSRLAATCFAVGLDGAAVNLTRTPNSAEDHPAVSPDAHTLAFITDAGASSSGDTCRSRRIRATTHSLQIWITLRHRAGLDGKWLPCGRNHGSGSSGGRRSLRAHPLDPAAEIRDARFRPTGAGSLTARTAQSAARNSSARSRHRRDSTVSATMENDHDPPFRATDSFLSFSRNGMSYNGLRPRPRGTIATLKSGCALMRLRSPRNAHALGHRAKTRRLRQWAVDLSGLMARRSRYRSKQRRYC